MHLPQKLKGSVQLMPDQLFSSLPPTYKILVQVLTSARSNLWATQHQRMKNEEFTASEFTQIFWLFPSPYQLVFRPVKLLQTRIQD